MLTLRVDALLGAPSLQMHQDHTGSSVHVNEDGGPAVPLQVTGRCQVACGSPGAFVPVAAVAPPLLPAPTCWKGTTSSGCPSNT